MRRSSEWMPSSSRPSPRVAEPPRSGRERARADRRRTDRTDRGRERHAFEELYSRYARSVLGLALRRLGDRGRAEDSVQEVFAAVWRSAATYDRRRGPGGAWLYTIARNAIVDAHRRRPAPTVPEPPELASTDPTPDEEAEASWNAWRVHRALEILPEKERAVIDLAYFSGLSQSEIAEFLDVPLGTVKTRTRSGLARLADALEGEL